MAATGPAEAGRAAGRGHLDGCYFDLQSLGDDSLEIAGLLTTRNVTSGPIRQYGRGVAWDEEVHEP